MHPTQAAQQHLVVHPAADRTVYRTVPDLAAALSLVEQLYNEQGVADAAVYALTPVPLTVRSYLRVAVAQEQGPANPAPAPTVPPEQARADREVPAGPGPQEGGAEHDPADDPLADQTVLPAQGKARGLGFFAH